MATRQFGRSGPAVSTIGQGTWQIDGRDRSAAIVALRRGIELGMTHIDTAEMYEGAEAIVAEAIEGQRARVFLVSKVLPGNASRQGTIRACERSLARLRTDHLDCYLLHWPGAHPIGETIAGFERLVADGKIRSWGVSNFNVADLEAAWRAGGEGRMACNQVLYHLQERAIEHAVMPWCTEHGVAVVAYSPFGSGEFPRPESRGGAVIEEIAQARVVTARQVALAFLVRHDGVFAIPKAANATHAADNAGALGLALDAAEIGRIEAAFPLGKDTGRLPML
jgi:diketogulonate reductase-like aldo/keto reductase